MSGAGVVVVSGLLVQRSALSVGGSDEDGLLDDAFCRDGRGRPTLRGTSLAGALLDSIRKCGFVDLPATVTGNAKSKRNDRFHGESVLRVWTSHPEECWHRHDTDYVPEFQPRAGVGIRQDTGAAKSGAMYDMEVLPAGTRWPLVVELDLWRYTQLQQGRLPAWSADELWATLQAGLKEWERRRCWIGRSVARGLGWMELRDVDYSHVPAADSLSWTRRVLFDRAARRNFSDVCHALATLHSNAIPAEPALPEIDTASPWTYRKLSGVIDIGARQDDWGLDSLSIGGHQAAWSQPAADHLIKPEDLMAQESSPEKPSDMSLAMAPTRNASGEVDWVPFVPGSGIRGCLRHELSRLRRKQGASVRDPLTGSNYQGAVSTSPRTKVSFPGYSLDALFGTLPAKSGSKPADAPHPNSSRLLVCDANLTSTDWHYAVMQMHAEDEFAASVFASCKFDRLAVLNAQFAFEMVIEAPPGEEPDAALTLDEIKSLLEREDGHGLALGGARWRGHGWVRWICDPVASAKAGQDWHSHAERTPQEGSI